MPKKPKWYALGVGDDEFPKSEPVRNKKKMYIYYQFEV